MRVNMWLFTLLTWVTSFQMIFSSSIYLSEYDKISFFFVAEYNSIVYKYHIFLIHSSVVWHLGCAHSLAIVNKAAKQMGCAGAFVVN
jgi:hypothetical protein